MITLVSSWDHTSSKIFTTSQKFTTVKQHNIYPLIIILNPILKNFDSFRKEEKNQTDIVKLCDT